MPSSWLFSGRRGSAAFLAVRFFTLALVLALAWPQPGAAQHMDANASAPTAGNMTDEPVTQPETSQPDATQSAAPEVVVPRVEGPSAESEPTQQKTRDGVEARGAMPEREPAPKSAGKPAPDTKPEATPLPGGNVGWSGYFQALGAIFLILAVLAGGFFLLKRFGPRAMGGGVFGRGTLQLEAQLPLGPRRSVAVVRFLNKRLVLGVTDSNITLLTETETGHDDEVPEHTSPAQGGGTAFSKMLAKARNPRA